MGVHHLRYFRLMDMVLQPRLCRSLLSLTKFEGHVHGQVKQNFRRINLGRCHPNGRSSRTSIEHLEKVDKSLTCHLYYVILAFNEILTNRRKHI